jgi:hypothetical protein
MTAPLDRIDRLFRRDAPTLADVDYRARRDGRARS